LTCIITCSSLSSLREYGPVHACLSGSLIVAQEWDWTPHCWSTLLRKSWKRGNFFNTLLRNIDLGSHWCKNGRRRKTKKISDNISVTMTYVIWREDHIWNVSVLQRARLVFY
jgi:hypothetical protein